MVSLKGLLAVAALLSSAHAHMKLHYPPPFAASNNPHHTGPADTRLEYPFNCCGRQTVYPCRGYLNLLGTDQGRPVATWPAGSTQKFSLVGSGTHYGGSCQAGFSVDKGKTWKVVSSYEGNCPHRKGRHDVPQQQTFPFTVPADMPPGDHVFAWTWINREQEFFMNCSPITITANNTQPPESGMPSNPSAGFPTATETESPAPETSTPVAPTYTDGHGQDKSEQKDPPVRRATEAQSPHFPTIAQRDSPRVAFKSRPDFLMANLGNGCKSPVTKAEVKYPNPGPDVVTGDGEYPLRLPWPEEKCQG